jgi:DNA polymerase alpha subunit B
MVSGGGDDIGMAGGVAMQGIVGPSGSACVSRALVVWAATGPFTLQDDLDYTPFQELLDEVIAAEQAPDVLVLMGPFVDSSHPVVARGDVRVKDADGADMPVTYDELRDARVVIQGLGRILQEPSMKHLQVIVIPSTDDITSPAVYPQPPEAWVPPGMFPEDVVARLHFLPNPATFSIGGVVFGASPTDLTHHMMKHEITKGVGGHRFLRVAKHMLDQRGFYPLFPAESCPMDLGQYPATTFLRHSPDVLLMSSRVGLQFAMPIEETLVVSMGKLTRGRAGGSYARMVFNPHSEASAEEKDGAVKANIGQRAKVEIRRI